MNTKRFTALGLSVLFLAACGGGGDDPGGTGDGSGGGDSVSETTVQTSATGTQSSTISSNATGSMRNLSQISLSGVVGAVPAYRSPVEKPDSRFNRLHAAEIRLSRSAGLYAAKAADAARAAASGEATQSFPTETVSCGDGGSYSYSGTYDDATYAYSMTFTFADCRESYADGDGEALNGNMTISSSDGTSYTSTMGDGDGVLERDQDLRMTLYSNNFANMYAETVLDLSMGLSYEMTGLDTYADTSDDSYTFNMTANGKERYDTFTEVFTITFTDFAAESSINADGSSGTDTVNGDFSQSWTAEDGSSTESASFTYANFANDWSQDTTAYDYEVNGTVTLDFTPDELCHEGTNTIATTTAIHVPHASGHPTAGVMTVNTATITYNSDGTVTVTENGDSTTYTSLAEMEQSCQLQDFEEPTVEVNDDGSGSTTASDMLVTLSWTGGETSDMDLHMNYYETSSPTAETELSSFVAYWGDVSCQSPLDETVYWEGMDVDGDGVCEAGLDYDDVSGYGPEHITAAALPDGYYVISVNSFSLDLDPNATVSVTIDLGDTLFTFPDHTFTTSDGEETDPDSWHRVADVRVSGGTAEVLTPDTGLDPWVTDSYSYYKPTSKVGK